MQDLGKCAACREAFTDVVQRVPGVTHPADRPMTWKDLWKADMGVVMRDYFFKDDVDGTKYGHLPKMAVASKGMMGSLMVSSFCECINSCANLVCTKNNSVLSDDEIDMVVTLRMNRDFMKHHATEPMWMMRMCTRV